MTFQRPLLQSIAITALFSLLLACSEDNGSKQQNDESASATAEIATQSDGISDGMEQEQHEEVDEEAEYTAQDTKKGLYVYHQNSATFTDCANGQSYPVAQEGNYYELEATYLALTDEEQQKLLFEVKGEYDERTSPESDEDVEMLIATELLGVVHKESCQ